MINIGLLGSAGRMGKLITHLIPSNFSSLARLGLSVGRGDPIEPLFKSDVIIDVSSPAAMANLARIAIHRSESLPCFVIGSTGWAREDKKSLEELSLIAPVLMASNFSAGVFALSHILKNYSSLLKKLGYTPVLVEKHHIHKKDAPSGTALTLQKSIQSEQSELIQTHCIRAGEVIGDHEISFFGSGDKLVLGHFAQDRSIFAKGAIDVALWMAQNRLQLSTGRILSMDDYFHFLKDLT